MNFYVKRIISGIQLILSVLKVKLLCNSLATKVFQKKTSQMPVNSQGVEHVAQGGCAVSVHGDFKEQAGESCKRAW